MRNSKKPISIILSMIMLIGVVFGVAAVSFADDMPQNSVNLTVGENIISHYYIDADYYVINKGASKFRYKYNNGDTQQKTEIVSEIESIEDNKDSQGRIQVDVSQAAAQIAEPITVELLDDSGEEIKSSISYTAKDYCDTIINMEDSALLPYSAHPTELKTLCKAIVTYGKSAQGVFESYMSKEGSVEITDDYSSELSLDDASCDSNIYKTDGNIRFRSVSFMCESTAKMRFYFTPLNANDSTDYGDPEVSSPFESSWSKGVDPDGAYNLFIQINNIAPAEFNTPITINYAGASISMSVLDYAGKVIASAATSSELKTLAKSLIRYNEAADEFFSVPQTVYVPAKAPTCTEAGWDAHYVLGGEAYSDADAKNKIDASVPALGHSFGEWTTVEAATCTEAGSKTRTCSRCGETENGVIDAPGHSYTSEVTQPTCTEQGYTTYTCSVCGDTYNGDYTAAKGHIVVNDAAVAATCTETGLTAGSHCSVCNEVLVAQETVDALGHSYNSVVTQPTCTEQGYTTYTCSRCNDIKVDDYTAAKGHTVINDAAVAPTHSTAGRSAGTHCSVCSQNLSGNAVISQLNIKVKLENTDKYLYRAGNGNNIKLGTLFEAEDAGISIDSANVSVSIANQDSNNSTAAGTFTKNSTTWTEGTIKFTGEGVVKLTLTQSGYESSVLYLEVVSGNNYTEGATLQGTMSNSVVLLGNAKVGYVSVTGQKVAALTLSSKNFFGNGFELDATQNSSTVKNTSTHGIISLTNSIFDNVRVIGPQFNSYVGSFGNENFSSVIWVYSGTSTVISNCRIQGASSPIRVMGDVTVKDSVLSGGVFANLELRSGNLSIDNVTTVNTQNSLGIVVADGTDSGSKIYINGALTQHNFISENATMSSDNAKTLKDTMFKSAYSKYQFTSGTTKYINTGIISMSEAFGASNIIDNREDKKNYSGMTATISAGISSFNGYFYTMENTDSSMLETSYTEPAYSSTTQKPYEPAFSWAVPSGDNVAAGGDEHCYKDSNGVLQIQFTTGGSKTLNVGSMATVKKYGKKSLASTVTCKNKNGNSVAVSNGSVTFNQKGEYTLTYTYTDNYIYNENGTVSQKTVTYAKEVKVNVAVKKQAPNAVITVSQTNGTMIWGTAGSSFDRDYQPAAQIFDYMTITDYDTDGNPYTVLDGSNQATFLSSISSVEADSDNKTGFTIYFPDGTKLAIKCGAPYNSGTLVFKKYNNKFLMCGSKAYNNATAATWYVNSYTYTGRNGVAVSYTTKRGFTSTTDTTNYSLSNLSTNKFLIYDAQGGDVNPPYDTASPATLPTPTREGYTFSNWNTKADGTGTAKNAGSSQSFSSTTTLYAIWAENITVSFNKNGGSSDPAPISSGAGMSATLPSVTRSGHWLKGWYDDPDEGTKIGNAGDSFSIPVSDTTYYAQWSPIYTVAYNANGGSVETEYESYSGTALILPTATLEGKTFDGWYTEADGGELVGVSGDPYAPTNHITLYAHWSDNIKVNFNGNGGTASTAFSTCPKGDSITLPGATRDGYSFSGWYTAAEGGTSAGGEGASYQPSTETTLYAHWTAYTVTYDANGGSVSPTSASGVVTLPTPTKTGYTFSGWYTAASGGTKIGDAGASYTPTADITIHAHWTVNSYTVTISTSNSTTTVTANGKTVKSGDSAAYNSVVKVELGYSESDKQTFSVKQGGNDVTRYSNEACTTTTTSQDAGTYYFKMPAGDVSISSSSSKSCITPDTLVTLKDGSQKRAEELTMDDEVLIWNFETGKYDSAKFIFIDSDPESTYNVVHLYFSDGTETELIYEHGYFDVELGKYVYITEDNYRDYIGDHFVKIESIEENTWTTVELIDSEICEEVTIPFGPTTQGSFCFFVDGLLSMPGGIEGMFNVFDVDAETMTYDFEALQNDIETYGLYTYEDFKDIISEEVFEMCGGAYLKISVGKGLITWDEIVEIAERYAPFFEQYN